MVVVVDLEEAIVFKNFQSCFLPLLLLLSSLFLSPLLSLASRLARITSAHLRVPNTTASPALK